MRIHLKSFALGFSITLAVLGVYALAVNLPNVFAAGDVISAKKMNDNFAALKTSIDSLETVSARFGNNTSLAARSGGAECTLGEIILSAGSRGQGIPAAGQLLPIAQNQALFSLLNTTYGGDGTTTFALPDLRSSTPNGLTYTICVEGVFPSLK